MHKEPRALRGDGSPMADIGVVYLCRFLEGEEPVRRFLTSYRAFSPGAGHDLHVIFKGFPDRNRLVAVRSLFDGTRINVIEATDAEFDIGSYIHAARWVRNRDLVFLNTFSEILASDWLRHFHKAHQVEGVGLVGASGSWLSNSSTYEGALRRALITTGQCLVRPRGHTDAATATGSRLRVLREKRPLRRYLLAPFDYVGKLYQYGRFPNPHIRTNAFMIARELFLSLEFPRFTDKQDAYRFESGRRSLTRQVIARGREPVLVDRNGVIYRQDEWKASSTFWTGDQVNLLIADNRTKDYAAADEALRNYLEDAAWVSPWSWRTTTMFRIKHW